MSGVLALVRGIRMSSLRGRRAGLRMVGRHARTTSSGHGSSMLSTLMSSMSHLLLFARSLATQEGRRRSVRRASTGRVECEDADGRAARRVRRVRALASMTIEGRSRLSRYWSLRLPRTESRVGKGRVAFSRLSTLRVGSRMMALSSKKVALLFENLLLKIATS